MKPSTTSSNNVQTKSTYHKGRKLIIYSIWLILWQFLYLGIGNEILVPSPMGTFIKLIQMLGDGEFYSEVLATLLRVAKGVVYSGVAGVITAYISYRNEFFYEFIKPLVNFMKATPVMAIIILALLWFKSGDVPVFVCILMCYPIIYTNIFTGLSGLHKPYKELSMVYKVKKSIYLTECIYPQLKPYIHAALQLAIGMGFKVVIASEILSVPRYSVGYKLLDAKVYLETTEIFAWIVVIMFLSQLSEYIVSSILKERSY